jgi:hypothetical protein
MLRRCMHPADTTADAHRLQGDIYRRMGGAERLSLTFQLTATVRGLAMAGVRSRHPEYTDDQVLRAWARMTLGDTLVTAVWPDRELVEP